MNFISKFAESDMNLIIATTKFQVFYINEIIKKEGIEDFFFIYKSNTKDDLNSVILKVVIEKAKKFIFYKNKKLPYDIIDASLISSRENTFKNVYISSVNNRYIQKILSNIKYKNLYTYDDGTANILKTSVFYKKISLIEKIINKVFNITKNTDVLKNSIIKHYTIYNNMNNITPKLEYFNPFFFDDGYKYNNRKNMAAIFIGPVFDEMFDDYIPIIENIRKIMLNKPCDFFYIPHPRNTIKTYFDEYLVKDDIGLAELFISDKAKEYSNINVYGFFSSAQINTIDISNVNCLVFKDVFKSKVDYSELVDKFKNINFI